MMRIWLALLFFLNLFAAETPLPTHGKKAQDFLPKNDSEAWLIQSVSGDVNKDGIEDIVAAIDLGGPRVLLVALGDGNGEYNSVLQNPHALMRADEGGMMGDPLDNGIFIKNDEIQIYFNGGSGRWHWTLWYHFDYNNGGWKLVRLGSDANGEMYEVESEVIDFNSDTYKFYGENDDKRKLIKEGNLTRTDTLMLKDFNIDANSSRVEYYADTDSMR